MPKRTISQQDSRILKESRYNIRKVFGEYIAWLQKPLKHSVATIGFTQKALNRWLDLPIRKVYPR